MPGANRLTLHVLTAAAEHGQHMIGERTRQALAAAKAGGINRKGEPLVLGNTKQAKQNKTDAWPEQRRCVRTSSVVLRLAAPRASAIATVLNARGVAAPNGGQWFPMQVRRVRDRLDP
jgi:DNA invertase Pin-like site-specific DNA recombinase